MDTIDELQFIEVDQEADGDVEELHVAEELGFVDGEDLLDGLGFNKDAIFNQEVETERFFAGGSFVVDLDGFLRDAVQLADFHFAHQAPLVDGFEEPGTLVAMHLDRSTDNGFGERGGFVEQGVHGLGKN